MSFQCDSLLIPVQSSPLNCLWYRCKSCFFTTHSFLIFVKHKSEKLCNSKKQRTAERFKWHFCKLCVYKTSNKQCLKSHFSTNHTPEERIKWFQCEQCEFRSKTRSYLKRHCYDKHEAESLTFTCHDCGITYKTKTSLMSHIYLKHWHQRDKSNWLRCDQCRLKFRNEFYLTRHRKKKHPLPHQIKWLYCDQCDFKTHGKPNLKMHIYHKHVPVEKIRWFKCEQCDYRAKLGHVLRRHITKMHDNPAQARKCLSCEMCHFKTYKLGNYQRHLDLHAGVTPPVEPVKSGRFKCEYCMYITDAVNSLRRHVDSRHQNVENAKWYKCEQCDYQALAQPIIQAHVRRAHPKRRRNKMVACEECGCQCPSVVSLRGHFLLYHSKTDLKKIDCFRCDYCDYESKRRPNLKRHLDKVHNLTMD